MRSTPMVFSRSRSAPLANPDITAGPASSSRMSVSADSRSISRSLRLPIIGQFAAGLPLLAAQPISAMKTGINGPVISSTSPIAHENQKLKPRITSGTLITRARAGA